MRRRIVALLLFLTFLGVSHDASAQPRFPRDTIWPHFARWNDELPASLATISSVLEFGFDSTENASLIRDFMTLRPPRPRAREEYRYANRTYLITTGFRGRQVPLYVGVYWLDTSVVAMRFHSVDNTLETAIDSALFALRTARLVKPASFRLSVGTTDGYDKAINSVTLDIAASNAPHCPGFGSEHRMRWERDTLLVQLLGVPPPGYCPNTARLRGNGYWFDKEPGRYVIAVDFRGDTNLVAMVVTDTSVALVPIRTTWMSAELTVKWRFPSASITLRCNREAGDLRLCDALHEFVASQPGIQRYRFPAGGVNPLGSQFESGRMAVYRYASAPTAEKIRRCVASIPAQTRLDSWVRVLGHPATGRWWAEAPTGTSSPRKGPAEILDASGNIPANCGDNPTLAQKNTPRPHTIAARAVQVIPISTSAFARTNPTGIEARSDGWISLTPLDREPFPTTHLYARASDALRWVQRVREVMSGASTGRDDGGGSDKFIPSLGRGWVNATTRITDSAGRKKVSFALHDCGRAARQYNMDTLALVAIVSDVEQAAIISQNASRVPSVPTQAIPYESGAVSCPVAGRTEITRLAFPESLSANERRITDVGMRFVVDTAGNVEPSSIVTLPDVPAAMAVAARAHVVSWHYRPAEWAGVAVRQYVNAIVTFDSTRALIPRPRDTLKDALGRPLSLVAPAPRSEVLASFIVDTYGLPDERTLIAMPGTDARAVAAIRRELSKFRFLPEVTNGRPRSDRIVRMWTVEPPAKSRAK